MRRRDRPEVPPETSPRLAALRLLGRRDYTTVELTRKLTDRGYEPDVVEQTLAALRADRSLDDARAAASHVRMASRIKGRGRHRIKRELEARGVPAAIAKAALDELPKEDESAQLARILARKRPAGALTPADRQRLFRQLLRRGFDGDAISRALRLDTDE